MLDRRRYLIPKNAVPQQEEGKDMWDEQMGSEVRIESSFRRAPSKRSSRANDFPDGGSGGSGGGGGGGGGGSGGGDQFPRGASMQGLLAGGAEDSGGSSGTMGVDVRPSRGGAARTQLSIN